MSVRFQGNLLPDFRASETIITRSPHLRLPAPALPELGLSSSGRGILHSLPTHEGAVTGTVGRLPLSVVAIFLRPEERNVEGHVDSVSRPARLSSRANCTSALLALCAAPWRSGRTSASRKEAKREPRRKCKWQLSRLPLWGTPAGVGERFLSRRVSRMARILVGLRWRCGVGKLNRGPAAAAAALRRADCFSPGLLGLTRAPFEPGFCREADRSCGIMGFVNSTDNTFLTSGDVRGSFVVHSGPRASPLLGPGGS